MKTVITYGTYDLLHEGHIRLLERAKALGDRLIVGVTSDSFDRERGKLNVHDKLLTRVENVRATGLADLIIVEEYQGQKIHDVEKFDVDIFAIGSDWAGKFDYLSDYCEVVYLPRTKGVSSTQLRSMSDGVLRIGIVGAGRSAERFIHEALCVSGVHVQSVFTPNQDEARDFSARFDIPMAAAQYEDLLEEVDAVYVASPHETHYTYTKQALEAGKHVLCETPLVLYKQEAIELFDLARHNGLVLLEATKTAFFVAFRRLVELARSGVVGKIRSVDATLTKLVSHGRELNASVGGALAEMGTYPLLAIVKLLGVGYESVSNEVFCDTSTGVDSFARINLRYPSAIASATVGIGVKSEGDLVVSGTEGYIYVPAPWWLTREFEVRYEDTRRNQRYYYSLKESGLRYELAQFAQMISKNELVNYKWTPEESIAVAQLLENARGQCNA